MHKLIGDKKFYLKVLAIMVPIVVQNSITNFVNMLDNIMVGQLGTTQMSGVAIANQIVVIYNLCVFGAVSGVGIFGTQFYGCDDKENFRNTFRFKTVFCLFLTAVSIIVMLVFGRDLSALYLKGESDAASSAATIEAAHNYIKIIVIGFVAHAFTQVIASSLREMGKTFMPMIAGVAAVFVNLGFNYVLIFGHFGAPEMGIRGAALATVISRFAELAILAVWVLKNRSQNTFVVGFFKNFNIPLQLCIRIMKKAFPLMVNETLWATGQALLTQCYSMRGLNVVAANNICHTFLMIFEVMLLAVGSTIAIITGQLLGAGNHEEAKDSASKLIFLSLVLSIVLGVLLAVMSEFIPNMYNTSNEVRRIARGLMIISAICLPIDSVSQALYFTLRSGGKVIITLLFDSGFVCLVSFPIAFVLANFTSLGIYVIYFAVMMVPIAKCIPGYILVKKGVWLNTLTKEV